MNVQFGQINIHRLELQTKPVPVSSNPYRAGRLEIDIQPAPGRSAKTDDTYQAERKKHQSIAPHAQAALRVSEDGDCFRGTTCGGELPVHSKAEAASFVALVQDAPISDAARKFFLGALEKYTRDKLSQ